MVQKTIRIGRSAKTGKFTIGAKASTQISKVEGLTLSKDMRSTFKGFEKKGASPEARRTELMDKYGKNAG